MKIKARLKSSIGLQLAMREGWLTSTLIDKLSPKAERNKPRGGMIQGAGPYVCSCAPWSLYLKYEGKGSHSEKGHKAQPVTKGGAWTWPDVGIKAWGAARYAILVACAPWSQGKGGAV